ncbi:MAG: hypothetical protein A2Y07_03445 [Planctomycetes bacterium GWF2_50_10]|nr:MAG: hypothetical protein A2Y07_03445 [Planctomycetes bacterium GWF2_50_10]
MKIVIAVDSFKGSLSAVEACDVIEKGFLEEEPSLSIVKIPLADGGEGTTEIIARSCQGEFTACRVMGPLPEMEVTAGYVWIEKTKTAVVEMAAASGITLLTKKQLNPMLTTTYGTGQLILEALKRKPEQILLAVGGSATVDGGIGAAMAMGWQFLNKSGKSIKLGAEELGQINHIVEPRENFKPGICKVLCDVTSPLTGPLGAAHVFGPQKGADAAMVEVLDRNLRHVAELVKQELGIEIDTIAGAGAAGGLAAGAIAFFNAKLVGGIETIAEMVKLTERCTGADWVITGEGCFDCQSLRGKVVSGVIQCGLQANARIGVIAGNVNLDQVSYQKAGIHDVASCVKPGIDVEYAMANAKDILFQNARDFAKRNFE